jgi:metal-responsive CopG/Arc/MetJ family transcriptional regulator
MKTAISIPDDIFFEAESAAEQLGLARSQLYAKAIREFIEHHGKDTVTEKLDRIYGDTILDELDMNDASLDQLRKATEHDTW